MRKYDNVLVMFLFGMYLIDNIFFRNIIFYKKKGRMC